jgi:hypothetical protein
MTLFGLSADQVALFLGTGVAAGVLAGLLGIGGGLIIVAVLVQLLPALGVPTDDVTRVALATALASIIATSVSSSWSHHRRGAVIWRNFLWLSPGLVVGGLLGAQLAGVLPDRVLRWVVGVFCLAMAGRLAFGGSPAAGGDTDAEPKAATLALSGVGIGALSALVGIGGGSMTVPLLIGLGVRPVRAVGTSAACGFPIGVASAVGFVLAGRDAVGLPPNCLGFVYWPGALLVAATSIACAPLGAALAHRLKGATLKRVFAVFLALIGLSVVLKA